MEANQMEPVFGKNHAMKAMLGAAGVDEYVELSFQLRNILNRCTSAPLNQDEKNQLIKLSNEIVYTLNRGVMNDAESDRVFHPRIRSIEERTPNSAD